MKMTCKLQLVITFATVVRLRSTIYQNAHNSEENPYKKIWSMIFLQKNVSKCLNFVFKDQTPTFFLFFFLSSFLLFLFFKISETFFIIFLFKFFQDNLGNSFNRQIGTQIQETQPQNYSSKPNCPQTEIVTELETEFKEIFFLQSLKETRTRTKNKNITRRKQERK